MKADPGGPRFEFLKRAKNHIVALRALMEEFGCYGMLVFFPPEEEGDSDNVASVAAYGKMTEDRVRDLACVCAKAFAENMIGEEPSNPNEESEDPDA